VWFAFDESRPLAFFAGLWTRWTSVRKVKEGETTNDLFGFLTTEPNAEVKAIHPNAMPVMLTTPAEVETWLTAPTADALALQRPLPDGALKIVARGDRTGDAPGELWPPEVDAGSQRRTQSRRRASGASRKPSFTRIALVVVKI